MRISPAAKFLCGGVIVVALLNSTSLAEKPVSPLGPLPTRWTGEVSRDLPLPEYPRPQMVRADWLNLNGRWDFTLTDAGAATIPAAFDSRILVPFPYESTLSGVGKPSVPERRLWYRRSFTVPAKWLADGRHVLLHFGAVNYRSEVFVNGADVGGHEGGYDPFQFDITADLKSGANELVVAVENPLKSDAPDAQILGKQRVRPGGVLYTASTGIWQTVWLEPASKVHITCIRLTPNIDDATLKVLLDAGSAAPAFKVTAFDDKGPVASANGNAGQPITLSIPRPHLWSPDDPWLYRLQVNGVGESTDSIESYFAMRKIALGKDLQGRTRILLNNKFIFEVGALDQGYWPDGLYTAPTDAALRFDIESAKTFGFNLLRKHAKVEPDRWYYWTDKLGILVWQDMPQVFGDHFTDATKAQWLEELRRLIAARANHPSIIVWTLFNEGWGQHDTREITALARQLDPTRLINAASGGYNQVVNGKMSHFRLPTPPGIGDINDTHTYPEPSVEADDPNRALACGEFGGISLRVPDHLWSRENFGYGAVMTNGWRLTARYQQLLRLGWQLCDRGASAIVYTQLADVEQETNGLMTYDRAVIKPVVEIVNAANRGEFPAMPPAPPSQDLVPTSQDQAQSWSYTASKPAADWYRPGFDASAWKTGPAPFGHGYAVNTAWTDTPGDIWLRRTVALPAVIPERLNVVALHDEDVDVYVNGILAASASGFTGDYEALPMSDEARASMKPGANLLAIHCHQTTGGQVIDVGIVERK